MGKPAAKAIYSLSSHRDVQDSSANVGVEWSFNLEKAPWWGGMFERMIRSVKRCLRKTIGRARITYDELLTAIAEGEMILNSRPISSRLTIVSREAKKSQRPLSELFTRNTAKKLANALAKPP